jgi:hypothetical protein
MNLFKIIIFFDNFFFNLFNSKGFYEISNIFNDKKFI